MKNLRSLGRWLTQKSYDPTEKGVEITAVSSHYGLLLSSLCLHKETGHFSDQNLSHRRKERHHKLKQEAETEGLNCVVKDQSSLLIILSAKYSKITYKDSPLSLAMITTLIEQPALHFFALVNPDIIASH